MREEQAQQTTNTVEGEATQAAKFGTFLGVYTPSLLTILGVMMYLRFGWVVGNVGVWRSLLIVLMASGITFITSLSASAIATNMRVGVGGEYYMVSRSLGLEVGGAVGIPLFMCRTLSITLYAFGLVEALAFFWPPSWGTLPAQWLAAGVILLITAIAGKSAELTLKLQIPIMIAVGLSLLALFGGILTGGFGTPEWGAHYERSATGGFWFVFAVFFPAVTGFTAGIGMSGDLKDPKRSIPRGTLLAVVTGTLIYLLILLGLGITAKVNGASLASLDPKAPPVWTKIAWLGSWLVMPGMLGAILSSAFGSALGGPRVLQALAADGVMPAGLARTTRTGQPMLATWITGAIALAAVGLGGLNSVGRWVTIFFLTLYVAVNLAAGVEALVGDPSYRPTIRVPWYVSFLGMFGAIAVMFLISPWVCIVAVSLEVLLYMLLRSRMMESHWGDVRAGWWTSLARISLLQLHKLRKRPRNWRPNLLVFTAQPDENIPLVQLAGWFNQRRGIVTVCQLTQGELGRIEFSAQDRLNELEDSFTKAGLTAFGEVDVVPDLESGMISIIQANGFAGLQSNMVMFGWPRSQESMARILRVMRVISRIHKNTLIAKMNPSPPSDSTPRCIDIWWRGKHHNAELMLILAHLLQQDPEWLRAKVRLRSIVDAETERQETQKALDEMLIEARLQADATVLVRQEDQDAFAIMEQQSKDATLVFLGLHIVPEGEEEHYAQTLCDLAERFPQVVFVRNEGIFAGKML